jgi:hypothetical protein
VRLDRGGPADISVPILVQLVVEKELDSQLARPIEKQALGADEVGVFRTLTNCPCSRVRGFDFRLTLPRCKIHESRLAPPVGDELSEISQGKYYVSRQFFHRFAKEEFFEALSLLKNIVENKAQGDQ